MKYSNQTKPVLAFAMALAGVIFFSSKAVFVKMAYKYEVDALSLLTLRLLFAFPVYLGVFIGASTKGKLSEFKGREYLKLILLGIVGYYLASLFDFSGLKYITASLERLILFIYPTMVLAISALVLKQKISTEQKIAVVITYLGVMLAFYQNSYSGGSNFWLGALLIFSSALMYAIYLVGTGNIISRFGTKLFTSFVMIVSSLACFLHFIISAKLGLFNFQIEVYLLAFAMSILCTVIPSFLISEAIRRIGAPNVAIIGSVGPISTIILATLFLGERISVFQLLGTIVVISGVLMLAINKNSKPNSNVALAKQKLKD
ncbi:MAG: EamA family transporter [Bacteroidales bacterium]|nr:EamA family transporter [Bacteroidales bacterium]MBN2821150.1 EamA family transporter [Bacteroidales bacterium]